MTTLDHRGVRVFLTGAQQGDHAAQVLRGMAARTSYQKHPEEWDALFAGVFALEHTRDKDIEHLRDRGGLLHFGQVRTHRTDEGDYLVLGGHDATARVAIVGRSTSALGALSLAGGAEGLEVTSDFASQLQAEQSGGAA